MNKLHSALAIASFTIAATAFAADNSFDKTLTVSSGANVTISTGSGYIKVTPGTDNQIHVVAHLRPNHSSGNADADSRIQQIVANPPVTQSGDNVTIGCTHCGDLYKNIAIDYDVTTPKSISLHAATGSGNVTVANIDGTVTATSGSGDINTENLAAVAKLQTGSGSIRASGIRGGANLQTGSGDIDLHQTAPGDVRASTGSGNIHLHGTNGTLTTSTGSGDIDVDGQPTVDWKLHTGSGDIRMNVGNNAKFSLDADTGSGSIHVDQPMTMQGTLNRHHVTGTVNGGGALIKAGTGSGDIIIKGTSSVSETRTTVVLPGATDCVANPTLAACK